ncbi:MAG: hypothetical protein ACRBDL_11495 [Alphaproteobacteria bacterium]
MIAELFYPRDFFKKYQTFYKGKKYPATVLSIKYRYFLNTVVMLKLDNGNRISFRLPLTIKKSSQFVPGVKTLAYVIDVSEGGQYALPDLPIVKYYYCLRQDLMEESTNV